MSLLGSMLLAIIINASIDTHVRNRFCMSVLVNGAHTLDEKGAVLNIDVFVEWARIIKLLSSPQNQKFDNGSAFNWLSGVQIYM